MNRYCACIKYSFRDLFILNLSLIFISRLKKRKERKPNLEQYLNLRCGLAGCDPSEPMLPCCLLDDASTAIAKTNAFSRRNRNPNTYHLMLE